MEDITHLVPDLKAPSVWGDQRDDFTALVRKRRADLPSGKTKGDLVNHRELGGPVTLTDWRNVRTYQTSQESTCFPNSRYNLFNSNVLIRYNYCHIKISET